MIQVEGLRKRFGDNHRYVRTALDSIIEVYEKTGAEGDAAHYRAMRNDAASTEDNQ